MIKTEGLTKRYANVVALDDLNLSVGKGEIFGFIGPNGAGKTTTIRILCGLMKPTSGKAYINGLEVSSNNIKEIKRCIGYMPDFFGVYEQMRVWEYLDFFGAAYGIKKKKRKDALDKAFSLTGTGQMRDYYIHTLSRGMKQRVGLARTLVHDPQLLVLDEPASGLDPAARIEFRQTLTNLKNLGKTILVSSHILPELSNFCDRVGILERSKLLAIGTMDEIMKEIRQHMIIEISVVGGVERAAAVLKDMPGVEGVEDYQEVLRVKFTGSDETASVLLKALVENKVEVIWFKEVEADLEEVFMKVTGRAAAGERKYAE